MAQNQKEQMLITRAFKFNMEEDDESNIHGVAAVYNQRVNIGNYFEEVIEPGAFDETDFRDVLFFVNHEINKIALARSRRNNPNSTMQLKVSDIGLEVKANVDIENNADAKTLVSAIKRGDIDGMSFMFRIQEQKWENMDTELPLRRILKIKKVIEVSAVNFPAYDETSLSARSGELDNSDLTALDRAKREYRQELDSSGFEIRKRKLLILNK